jgi:hypothetical protein
MIVDNFFGARFVDSAVSIMFFPGVSQLPGHVAEQIRSVALRKNYGRRGFYVA